MTSNAKLVTLDRSRLRHAARRTTSSCAPLRVCDGRSTHRRIVPPRSRHVRRRVARFHHSITVKPAWKPPAVLPSLTPTSMNNAGFRIPERPIMMSMPSEGLKKRSKPGSSA